MLGIYSGGHCEDCGDSWGPLDAPPMPKCKPQKPDVDFGRVLDDISIIMGIDVTGQGRSIADIKGGAE